jgi:rhodanese-related sulfurtransferase
MRKVTVDDARERLADHERVAIVDARNAEAWEKAKKKGAGAIRIPPDAVEEHISDVSRDDYIIVYCT